MSNQESTRAAIQSALAIMQRTRLGSVAREVLPAFQQIRNYDDFMELYNVYLPKFPRPSPTEWNHAERTLEAHEEASISVIPFGDHRYPPYMATMQDAPAILFVRGNPKCFELLPGAAVVGTRAASPAGLKIAERIARALSEKGWPIVSGLALGIDAAAHEGALLGGTPTVAVLAHGLDKASPPRNALLGKRILDAGGMWVSEHPIGTHPRPQYFVDRNRIQIGLSAGSIIVEGKERSGTITQAQFCVREKRPLFAVLPQSSDNPLGLISEGPVLLMRKFGAIAIRSSDDYPKVEKTLTNARDTLRTSLEYGAQARLA